MKFSESRGWKILPLCLSTLLTACGGLTMERLTNPWGGPVEHSRLPADAVAYTCNGGKPLYVRYDAKSEFAMVLYPDREFRLDAEAGQAGSRFSNGRTTLSIKDAEATVEEGGAAVYAGCKRTANKTS